MRLRSFSWSSGPPQLYVMGYAHNRSPLSAPLLKWYCPPSTSLPVFDAARPRPTARIARGAWLLPLHSRRAALIRISLELRLLNTSDCPVLVYIAISFHYLARGSVIQLSESSSTAGVFNRYENTLQPTRSRGQYVLCGSTPRFPTQWLILWSWTNGSGIRHELFARDNVSQATAHTGD
jgi:hypothetical protein